MPRKIKIAGRVYVAEPLPARESLDAVIKLSGIIHDAAPVLAILADPSKKLRTAAVLRVVKERTELPDLIFELVSLATGIEISVLENDATLKEVLTVLVEMVRVNDWDIIWRSAMNLRITDTNTFTDWVFARIPRLRLRW